MANADTNSGENW